MKRWAQVRFILAIVLTVAALIVGVIAGYMDLDRHP